MNTTDVTLNKQIEILTLDMLTMVRNAEREPKYIYNLVTALGYIETLQDAIISLKIDIKREIKNRS